MAIRTKFEIEFSLSETAAGGEELGGAIPSWSGTSDAMDEGGTFKRTFAPSTTDAVVDLNGLTTCRLLAIKSDQTITIKKNSSGGEAWTCKALGPGAVDGVWLMTTDGITSLYISVPGSTAAKVVFSFAGVV